jgi:hypothetical protein
MKGNPRLNLAFTATLFNKHPALDAPDPSKVAQRKRVKEVGMKVEDILVIGTTHSTHTHSHLPKTQIFLLLSQASSTRICLEAGELNGTKIMAH